MYEDFKYTEVTRKIIGCAMEVHKFLGNGFQESVYQKAMAIEMQIQGLPFNREFAMPVYYPRILGLNLAQITDPAKCPDICSGRRREGVKSNWYSVISNQSPLLTQSHTHLLHSYALTFLRSYILTVSHALTFSRSHAGDDGLTSILLGKVRGFIFNRSITICPISSG